MIPDALREIETPAAVIDVARVRANAQRVADYGRAHGLAWRPHIKTHKSRAVARIQLAAGARGLTVATPREAEVMSTVSDDILLAYPPVGSARLARVLQLPERVRLSVALDSEEALVAVARGARDAGRTVHVLVEIDVGLRRTGVATHVEAVRLAERAAELDGVRWAGVLFYPGHVRGAQGTQEAALAELSGRVGDTLRALDAAGFPAKGVSGGSTPTLWSSHRVAGLTEIRAGSCIFHDVEAVEVGTAKEDQVAYTVLATVVSTAVPGQAVVDAGSKALAKEARGGAGTFGRLLGSPEVAVSQLSEEHGVLDLSASDWRPRIGERVRIVPNHVCVSVNLQDRLLALDGDAVEVWPLEARGREPYALPASALG